MVHTLGRSPTQACQPEAGDGAVYTWGGNAFGELGHGCVAHHPSPRQLASMRGWRLVFAACGASHNLLLAVPRDP